MNFNFSTWSIHNPIPTIVLFIALVVAGIFSYASMSVNNMPNVVIPVVLVHITEPGASPIEIENQITKKVESSLSAVQGIKHMTSTITEGTSLTTIEFDLKVDFDRAVNDSRDAVAKVRDQLPKTIQEPIIQRMEIDGGAVLIYSISAPDKSLEDISWFVDDNLNRELMSIKGVASVKRDGGIDHEITINLDQKKLAAFKITANEISNQLARANIDLPGGRITVNNVEYGLRSLGSALKVEMLKQLRIILSDGKNIKLSELAQIVDGGAEIRSITKMNNRPVITFQIFKSKGSSEVDLATKVEKKLREVEINNPDIKFKQIFSLSDFTRRSFKSTKSTFLEGAILTILVVFLFLRDKRATIIAAMAIPLSIIPTFFVMDLLGFSLNAVTLLSISLATGVLVDDAIVEIENIHRHMREGKSAFQASIVAVEEIGLAVVATTLVICVVFLPVSFMGGISGQYFKQFGLTVAIAAFFSLTVARLLTPMLCAYFLDDESAREQKSLEKNPQKQIYDFAGSYQKLIIWTLDNRLKTLAFAFVIMIASFALVPFISSGFIPYEDYSQSKISIELPKGSTLKDSEEVANKALKILEKRQEIDYILINVGSQSSNTAIPGVSASGGSGGINTVELLIKLIPPNQRKLNQRDFEKEVLPNLTRIPDIKINFANSSGLKDIIIALVSDDDKALDKAALAAKREMSGLSEITSVSISNSQINPEIIIKPDFDKMAMLGISLTQMNDAIKVATIGDIDANLAKFNYNGRQIPIRVRLASDKKLNLADIKNLIVATKNQKRILLGAVAQVEFGFGPTLINRYDRQRKIALEANLNGVPLGEAINKIYQLSAIKNLPPNVKILNVGDAEIMEEFFNGFAKAIFTGILMVYLIQVLLYKDWIQPFTRMAALPLSIGGAFLILLITNTDLNMPAIIGILMLMGIVDKNSILLVDSMLEQIRKGVPKKEAILFSCKIRARPILMTSITMLAGMTPIALKLGQDSAFRAPMAIAVIGGLISSTALSLIFVPVLFSYVKDFELWFFPKIKKFRKYNR